MVTTAGSISSAMAANASWRSASRAALAFGAAVRSSARTGRGVRGARRAARPTTLTQANLLTLCLLPGVPARSERAGAVWFRACPRNAYDISCDLLAGYPAFGIGECRLAHDIRFVAGHMLKI